MKDKIRFNIHRDDEGFDEVRIETIPRYKTSHMSGDEWRTSATVKIFRKKILLYEMRYQNVEAAAKHLPWLLYTLGERISEFHKEAGGCLYKNPYYDKNGLWSGKPFSLCFQPGCDKKATVVYRIISRYTREGIEIKSRNLDRAEHRAFCEKHKTRGDCGLEDADRNYELMNIMPSDLEDDELSVDVDQFMKDRFFKIRPVNFQNSPGV